MARIRTIKPEFFTSLTIGDLSFEQRLTFIGLWTHVDDTGRCVDEARLIRGALWSVDDRPVPDVEDDLRVLAEAELIQRYTVRNRRYLVVAGWVEHQKINRPTPSKWPPPEMGTPTPPQPSRRAHGALMEASIGLSESPSGALKSTPSSTLTADVTIRPENATPPAADDNPCEALTSDGNGVMEGSMRTHGALHEDSRPERKGKEQGTGNRDKESSALVEGDNPLRLVAGEVDSTKSSDDDSTTQDEEAIEEEKAVEPVREDVEKICLTLADRIEANGSKRPTITKRWRDAARRMIDLDGRTLDQVLTAIDWSQNDEFWHANILSVPKLRTKYDQLRLAATRERKQLATAGGTNRPSTATQRAAEGYALSERLAAQEAGR